MPRFLPGPDHLPVHPPITVLRFSSYTFRDALPPSARSGDMSVQVNSTMTVRQTIAIAQVIPQYRHTEGQGRRRLLTPDEVLRLPNEEMLCVIRGCNLLKLEKLDFTKHPMSRQIVRASIMDYQPATIFTAPILSEPVPVAEPEKKPARKKSLYSSAKPPAEF